MTETINWSSSDDWDAAQSESGVVHEDTGDPTADTVRMGYAPGDIQDLLGFWTLNEESGDTALDYSGNGLDGTLNNVTQGFDGILGGTAYDFNGTDSYVTLGTPSELSPESLGASLSVFQWVYPRDVTDRRHSFNKGGADGNDVYTLGCEDDGIEVFIDSGDNTGNIWGSLSTDAWQSIGFAYDGNGDVYSDSGMYGYIDGSQVGSDTSISGDLETSDAPTVIGSRGEGDERLWDGGIALTIVTGGVISESRFQELHDIAATISSLRTERRGI